MDLTLQRLKLYLLFSIGTEENPQFHQYEIAEPNGFDAAKFNLQKDSGRYGRDVFFSPDKYTFTPHVHIDGLTHRFDELVGEFQNRGFEANVTMLIVTEDPVLMTQTPYVLGQLDFKSAETNLYDYFTCTIIQLNDESIVKQRLDVKVDLYSDEDYNGNAIAPLVPEQILIKALPLFQISEWKEAGIDTTGYLVPSNSAISIAFTPVITRSGIDSSLSPELNPILGNSNNGRDSFNFIEAQNNLVKNTLSISNGSWTTENKAGASFVLYYAIGVDFNAADKVVLESLPFTAADYSNSWDLPNINRNEKLWVWFRYVNPSDGMVAVADFNSATFKMESTSISIDSLTDGIRLIDAMKQVIKSTSGLDVVAPRFDVGGEHYDQYVFKGNQIRLIQDKPFTLSFKDVLDYIPEVNCDYQVNSDGTVFVGHETDFYANSNGGSFETLPNSVFKQYTNDRLTYNKINFKYDKFEKGENDLQPSALDGVNTEFEMALPNRFVEDTLDIKIGFIRDAFLLEKTRKDSILVTDDAPTRTDEDTFILDVIDSGSPIEQEETMLLNHAIVDDNHLDLINDNSFNWILAGFFVSQSVFITGENGGQYQVIGVTANTLSLVKNFSPNPDFSGISLTTVAWTIQTTLVNRTNEGFFSITGTEIDGFANLKYAAKRNLRKYYRGQIKAAAIYYPSGLVRNTFFRNGAGVEAVFSNELLFTSGRQDRDLQINLLGLPILSTFIIETEVICTFPEFWAAMQEVRNEKKYLEVKDTRGNIVKLHPIEMSFSMSENLLFIKGEKRDG